MKYIILKKIIIIFILALTTLSANEELDWIVFHGGIAGTPSSSVKEMDELVRDKDIDEIRELIFDNNIALQGLSVIVLELFSENNIIELNQDEINQMNILYISEEELGYGSGCTIEKTLTLAKLLQQDSGIRGQARIRYIRMIEEYYLNE